MKPGTCFRIGIWLGALALSAVELAGAAETGADASPSFTFGPPRGAAPLHVTFNNTTAFDLYNTNSLWDFGDGARTNTPMSATPVHQYTRPGAYRVVLTVMNSRGGSNSYTNPSPLVVTGTLGLAKTGARITSVRVNGGQLTITGTNVPSAAGHAYRVMSSTDQREIWQPVATNIFGPDGGFTCTVPMSGAKLSFNIEEL